jgi:hypothetical protein
VLLGVAAMVWVAAGTLNVGCVFDLGEVVPAAAGGSNANGGSGGAGQGGAGGAGGNTPVAMRSRVTLDGSLLDETLVDFPIALALEPNQVDATTAGVDGSGLRFYDDTGRLIPHEIERWVPGGTSHVWVRVPTVLLGAETVLWARSGEEGVPALPTSDVWTAYEGVFHFADSLPMGPVRDASPNAREGTPIGLDAANVTEALIGPGYLFDGVDMAPSPHILLGDVDAFRVPADGALTVELWFKRSSPTAELGFLAGMEECCLGWGINLLPVPLQMRNLVGTGDCCSGATAYTYAQYPLGSDDDTAWHYNVAVFDRENGVATAYLDGVEASTDTIVASTLANQGPLRLGANFAGDDGFDGLMDEVRLRASTLTPAWITFTYATTLGTVVTVGQPEPIP